MFKFFITDVGAISVHAHSIFITVICSKITLINICKQNCQFKEMDKEFYIMNSVNKLYFKIILVVLP